MFEWATTTRLLEVRQIYTIRLQLWFIVIIATVVIIAMTLTTAVSSASASAVINIIIVDILIIKKVNHVLIVVVIAALRIVLCELHNPTYCVMTATIGILSWAIRHAW
jgi:hypothetical protein